MRLMTLTLASLLVGLGTPLLAASSEPAQVLVEDTTVQILTAIRSERDSFDENPRRLRELIDEIVFPHFDLVQMSRRVLGKKSWRRAPSEQRDAFVKEFHDLLMRTYATALVEYSDQEVRFLPPRMGSRETLITVRMEVPSPGAMAIPINYSMYLRDEMWKVYDVSVDGVSLVISYRATFASKVRENGLPALIEELSAHNKKGLE